MTTHDAPPTNLNFATAPEWVRPMVAAKLAGGVSRRTIARWAACGFIRVSRPAGGTCLVDRDSLRSFVESAAR